MLSTCSFKIVALGINHDAEIYLNDVFIGKHVGGYTTIEFEIPDNTLQLGAENAVKIIVNNTLSARSTLPLRKQIWGWRNYGGILRDLYILAVPKLWIDELRLQSGVDEALAQGTVNVTATLNSKVLEGSDDSVSVRVRSGQPMFVLELAEKYSGAIVAQSSPQPVNVLVNRDIEVQASLAVNAPKLWSPENPELYLLKAKVVVQEGKQTKLVDELDRPIGFTRVEVKNALFHVNGKGMVMNGVLWHEDSPTYGASLTYEQMEKDIVLIKMMGANSIRFVFHPPHPYVLDLCSRYGLFALIEIPAFNVPAEILDQESFQVLAETMLNEMVRRDQSQPSILAWGIGDEFDSADPRSRGYVERMVAASKKLDPRPVFFGSHILTDNVCSNLVDIAAVSLPTGDVKSFKALLMEWKKKHPDRPVLLLRYGKDVEPNNRNGYSDPMSQEAQARFFEKFYAAIKEAKIAGSFIASFADWRGDRPIMTVNIGEPYVYPMGLVSRNREKRASYDHVKSLYNSEKITALPIGRFRSTFPVAHIAYGFLIIFVVAYVYHYNRRFNETFKRSLIRPYNFFADLRDVHSVSVPQTIILSIAASMTMGLMLSGILYHYRTNPFADYILTQLVVWDTLKEWLIAAVWNPFQGIAAFSLLFLLWYPITAGCIKLFSVLVKVRIFWYHAFAVAIWGSLPIVFLSPLGMALFKLLETDFYVIPAFALMLFVFAWSLVRVLKGVSVLYDVSPARAFLGGLGFTVLVLGGILIYFESAYAIIAYFEFILHIARSLT